MTLTSSSFLGRIRLEHQPLRRVGDYVDQIFLPLFRISRCRLNHVLVHVVMMSVFATLRRDFEPLVECDEYHDNSHEIIIETEMAELKDNKQSIIIEIGIDGDVILVIRPEKVKLRVHSLFLKAASRPFSAMFRLD